MNNQEKEKFLIYSNSRFYAYTDEKLMCMISITNDDRIKYMRKRYLDYDFVVSVGNDVLKGKVSRKNVINILKKLDYFDDMFPPCKKAIEILLSKYGNEYFISCPLMKTNDGKLVPLYQLENYDWN